MRKILFTAVLFNAVITSQAVHSAGLDFFMTGSYWNTCWKNVTAEEFTDDAFTDIDEIRIVQNMKYHVPLMDQDSENTNNMINVIQKSSEGIVAVLYKSYESLAEARTSLDTNFLKNKLEYIRAIEEEGLNEEEMGFFNDGNGKEGVINKNTQSYAHYKNVCKRNKMFAKVASPEFQTSKSLKIASTVQKATASATQNSSLASQGKTKINSHFNNWCSAEEIKNGICDNSQLTSCESDSGVCKSGEEFKLANADIDSVNLLTPIGVKDKNAIVDELFETNYTYDEDQEQAAKDFAYNLVYAGSIPAPTIKEKEDPSKAEFVQAYNNHLASLNLAHFTYANIVEMRAAVNEETDPIVVSELDVIHYILHNMKNPDNLATVMSGKSKGIDLAMFVMLTLKNKLEFYKYEQNQRIEGLLAAILAQEATSPNNFQYAEYLKK